MNKKTLQVRAWKELMKMVANIQDPLLKRGMITEFREKALRDWGWDPTTGNLAPTDNAPLTEWEKQFLEDARLSADYGVNVRAEKQGIERKETVANMQAYVRDGGTLDGIPDNIRTPDIEKLYWDCKDYEHEQMMAQCDNIIARNDKPKPGAEHIGDILPRVLSEIKAKMEAHNDKTTND